MANNGELRSSELTAIAGGFLQHEAAESWKAPGGPEAAGLRPGGPNSSYRVKGPITRYGSQEYFYAHQPPLAAYPGTSNHGWGLAVDLEAEWMRGWIDDHGAKFGWAKTEAFSEWWHVNFRPGSGPFKPAFDPLQQGDRGKRVKFYTKRLAFIHRAHGRAYLDRPVGRPGAKFKDDVEMAVRRFQSDHKLEVDGVIGEETAHKIGEIFHKQYIARKKKRHRSKKMAVRETLATTVAKVKGTHSNHPHDHQEEQ